MKKSGILLAICFLLIGAGAFFVFPAKVLAGLCSYTSSNCNGACGVCACTNVCNSTCTCCNNNRDCLNHCAACTGKVCSGSCSATVPCPTDRNYTCERNQCCYWGTDGTYDCGCGGGGGGGGASTPTPTPTPVCTPNSWDATNCRRCNSTGTAWGANCTDYGVTGDSGFTWDKWCDCKFKCEVTSQKYWSACGATKGWCSPGTTCDTGWVTAPTKDTGCTSCQRISATGKYLACENNGKKDFLELTVAVPIFLPPLKV